MKDKILSPGPEASETAVIEPEAKRPEVARLHAAVRDWFDANIRNSPVSRATEAYNHLYRSLPDLQTRLEAALKEV